jgi:hypothetical protein
VGITTLPCKRWAVELRKDDEEEEEEEIIWCIFSCSVHIRLYIKIKRF